MTDRIPFCLLLAMLLMITTAAQADSFNDSLHQLDNEKADIRMTAAWALAKSGDERAVVPLIKHLDDKDGDVREWIVLALRKLGQPAIDPLIGALTNNSITVRWQAAATLGLIGDVRAAQPLIQSLADTNNETRYWAAIALAQINNSSSRDPLIQSLGDVNASVRKAAGWALTKTEGPTAIDLFISILKGENSSRRMGAAEALGEINDNRVLYPLLTALSDQESGVRASAATSLGRLNNMSFAVLVQVSSIQPLVEMLGDESPEVRSEAKTSLARMGLPAVEALTQALSAGNSLKSSEAAAVLGDIGDEKAVVPLIAAFKTGEAKARHNAVLALMKLNRTSGVETFLELLESGNSDVRADAAWALGLTGDERAKSPLLQAMAEDEDDNVRLNSSNALRQLGRKWDPVALEW